MISSHLLWFLSSVEPYFQLWPGSWEVRNCLKSLSLTPLSTNFIVFSFCCGQYQLWIRLVVSTSRVTCNSCSGAVRMYNCVCPVAGRCRSVCRIVFIRSNAGIVGSNPTQGMDVCVHLFCVRVVLCVCSCLETGWSPVQGVLPTVYKSKNLKRWPRSKGL
jgi:hypothetical protein